MTLENIISFAVGVLAINVPTPNIDIQTPLQDMFSANDLHELVLSSIKVIIAGFGSVLITKVIKFFSKKEDKA